MKRLFFLMLVTISGLSLITSCGGGKQAGGTIIGTVNNTFHGGGVQEAKVALTSDRTVIATTTTDISGNFTFSGISPGSYTIEVTKDGFFDNEVGGIKVEKNKETKVEIGLIVAFGGT
jgi:hypothetical protein